MQFDFKKLNYEISKKIKHKKLYKYAPLNSYTLDSIKNDYIWLSKPSELNDPFELFISGDCDYNAQIDLANAFDFFQDKSKTDEWHSRVKCGENIIEVLKEMIDYSNDTAENQIQKITLNDFAKTVTEIYLEASQNFTQKIDETYLIGSLTTEPFSIPMWSHYADCHKGVCIEYDLSQNYSINQSIKPVIYKNLMVSCDDIINNDALEILPLLKSEEWKYEKEWRVIFNNSKPSDKNRYFPAKPSAIYLGDKGYLDDNKVTCLNAISKEKGIDFFIVYKSSYEYKLEAFNTKDLSL